MDEFEEARSALLKLRISMPLQSNFFYCRLSLRSTVDELSAKVDEEKRNREVAVKQRQIVEKRVAELEALLEDASKARKDALERVKKINEQNQVHFPTISQLAAEL